MVESPCSLASQMIMESSGQDTKAKYRENSKLLTQALWLTQLIDVELIPSDPKGSQHRVRDMEFNRRLWDQSKIPSTDSLYIENILAFKTETKLRCVSRMADMLRSMDPPGIRLPATREHLSIALEKAHLPLVVTAGTKIATSHGFDSFEEVINTLGRTNRSVYRGGNTVEVDNHELRSAFLGNRRSNAAPRNFLDLDDRSEFQHKLDEIIRVDLLRRVQSVDLRNADSVEPSQGFVILSQAGSISPFHIDKAGANTWVMVLRGLKIWYLAAGLAAPVLFMENEPHFSNYDVVHRLPLHRNDTL